MDNYANVWIFETMSLTKGCSGQAIGPCYPDNAVQEKCNNATAILDAEKQHVSTTVKYVKNTTMPRTEKHINNAQSRIFSCHPALRALPYSEQLPPSPPARPSCPEQSALPIPQ